MGRLMSGVGIYLTVVLLLNYASGAQAAGPPTAGKTGRVGPDTAQAADMTAFDLGSLRASRAVKSAYRGPGRFGASEAGLARNRVPEKPGKGFHGPAVNYQAGLHGPVIELGLLGGTVQPKQRLAHMALDWDF